MSPREKMYLSNKKIKKFLVSLGFKNFYSFPHSRFSKDYIIDDEGFDMICTCQNKIWMIQLKTNKNLPSKIKKKYKELEERYGIRCAWATRDTKKRTIKLYTTQAVYELKKKELLVYF